MNRYLDIAPEVKEALDAGKPVVALESTIISHGMPSENQVTGTSCPSCAGRETVMAGRMGRTCEGVKGWLNIKRTPCAESGAANSAAAAGWTACFL